MIEYVVAAIVVFMGLVALWKARPGLRKFVRITDALDNLPDFIDRTDADLMEIRDAVFPNHGSAIPDGIARLEVDVTAIIGRLDGLERWVQAESDEADGEHATLQGRIKALEPRKTHERGDN